MARDLLLKKTKRDWSRESSASDESGYSRCTEIVVRSEPQRSNVLYWAIGLSAGTRLLTGKWPWYWATRAREHFEGR